MWARRRSYKQAVAKARAGFAEDYKKRLVILHKGEFIVVTKQRLKQLYPGDIVRTVKQNAVFTIPNKSKACI